MVYLQENTPFDYHRLMSEYGRFLECTRAIQSGYYKRSIDNPLESSNPIETRGNVSDFADMGVDNKDHDGMSVEEYLRLFNLFNKTSKPAQQSTPETRPSMKEFDKIRQRYL
ncbi:hypothetical protein DPMN_015280 [Dreissena polymorpha]|uniref:Uncharacterized protein n=1 Tax=Dreissena polymorpha TaxID=45954 RepID=A0A9D4NBA5_DREPO|nr:hypothetical protein DPMN_015280 [Dreissena polymorpha]